MESPVTSRTSISFRSIRVARPDLLSSRESGSETPAPVSKDLFSRRKVRIVILTITLLGTIALAWATTSYWRTPKIRTLVAAVPDFSLTDAVSGKTIALTQLEANTVVLVFTGTNCPVGDLYMPRLARLSERYRDRGVQFLAVNSNASETFDQIAEHASALGVTFPVLRDEHNRLADQVRAERTCEALVIETRTRKLLYQGAIDDQYGLGSRKGQPTREYLVEVLDALLAGKSVPILTTQVVGCPIERETIKPREKLRPPKLPVKEPETSMEIGNVTYAGDVAAILHTKCASCHRPGQVGPFSLLTYEHARRWAASIAEVVEDGRMPPWHADPRFGHFENDRSLTARERAILLKWVSQEARAGDVAIAPKPPAFTEGWAIGTPDLVIEMPESFTVPAEGTVPIQKIKIPTKFSQDLWAQAIEVRPSDRAVVHHLFVRVADKSMRKDPEEHAYATIAGYVPGDSPSIFPEGVGRRIPAGADLHFDIHYTPIGQVRHDRLSVGIVLAKKTPRHSAVSKGILDKKFWIPPGEPNYASQASWTVPSNSHLLSLSPHMHLRGKDFSYTATFPDGRSETLLSVPAYDFAWQSVYRLSEPLKLPKGTRIDCVAHFDNSAANPANPDPTKPVHWGEQSTDEMMIGYLDYYEDGPIALGNRSNNK